MKIKVEEVKIRNGGSIAITSNSPFYPDGKGGQLGDRGKISNLNVLKVYEKNGKIHHVLNGILKTGEYDFWIDESRRVEIARNHTAQHILSASFIKIEDLRTVSFHMEETFSTIDLDAYPIEEETLEKVEDLANDIILENRRVHEYFLEKEEAMKLPLRRPLSDKIKGKVRIIEIEGFDMNACAGFHVERTGEIGIVKILKYEKVKGSLTRIYFVAGKRALAEYRKRVNLMNRLSKKLTTSIDELETRINTMMMDMELKKKEFEKLARDYSTLILKDLLERSESIGRIKIIYYDGFKGYDSVANHVLKLSNNLKNTLVVVRIEKGYQIASNDLNIAELIKKLIGKIDAKGGAGKNIGRIITNMGKTKFMEELKSILKEFIL